ncbi:unnamed protein product, partial [Eruca vesicaria subsp. sativa]|nr:unnamed protein product [Eruca vesicaria subsp. sativa]
MCKETIDREVFDNHKGEICPKRIVTCEFLKYVATARNSVINATAMLDCKKHIAIKPNALVLCSTMLNHP